MRKTGCRAHFNGDRLDDHPARIWGEAKALRIGLLKGGLERDQTGFKGQDQRGVAALSFNAGVYPVQLTVTNAQGCQDTITYNVVVYDELTFPNVITPNGDLSNDYLEIEALKPNSELSILNRWGNVVYKSSNYQNDWNGKDQQGVDLKEGVYTVIFISSENKLFHFYVHLIR